LHRRPPVEHHHAVFGTTAFRGTAVVVPQFQFTTLVLVLVGVLASRALQYKFLFLATTSFPSAAAAAAATVSAATVSAAAAAAVAVVADPSVTAAAVVPALPTVRRGPRRGQFQPSLFGALGRSVRARWAVLPRPGPFARHIILFTAQSLVGRREPWVGGGVDLLLGGTGRAGRARR